MATTLSLKIIFGAAGLAIATAAYVNRINLANTLIKISSPTPLQFAQKNGQRYSEETREFLKKYNDVRVIENGSMRLSFFCSVNPSICKDQEFTTDKSFVPSPAGISLGLSPTLILEPYSEDMGNIEIKRKTRKFPSNSIVTPQIFFTFNLMHELGHVDLYKKDFERFLSAEPFEKELYADRFSRPVLEKEFGYVGNKFPAYYRAFHQHTPEYDTMLPLLRKPLPDTAEEIVTQNQERASEEPYRITLRPCLQATRFMDQTQDKTAEFMMDCMYYEAVTHKSPDFLVSIRQAGYVMAYEAFFGKPKELIDPFQPR